MLGVIVMISPLTRHSFLLSSSTGEVRGRGRGVWAVWLAAKQPITGRRAGYAAVAPVFMFSIHSASTGPSNMIHFLSGVVSCRQGE